MICNLCNKKCSENKINPPTDCPLNFADRKDDIQECERKKNTKVGTK